MTETSGDVAARGLDQAIDELRQWVIEGDYRSPVPLSNALGHIYTLEGSSYTELGRKYYTIRDNDPNGQAVAGIVFARARFTHHDALVETLEGRRPFRVGRSAVRGGDTLRGGGVIVRWLPRADLPKGRTELYGRDKNYDRRVAGRDVLVTLEPGAGILHHAAIDLERGTVLDHPRLADVRSVLEHVRSSGAEHFGEDSGDMIGRGLGGDGPGYCVEEGSPLAATVGNDPVLGFDAATKVG